MNKHFINVTKKLKFKTTETETNEHTLSEILYRYIENQSIVPKNLFSFKPVTFEKVFKTLFFKRQ